MVRLACVALFSTLMATAAAAQTSLSPEAWRIREVHVPSQDQQLPALQIGPTGRLGLGMFGIKPENARHRAVIVRDVTAPRHRRPGVGFSLKF